jgi:hypothetical protein
MTFRSKALHTKKFYIQKENLDESVKKFSFRQNRQANETSAKAGIANETRGKAQSELAVGSGLGSGYSFRRRGGAS